jgi:hypothetical protein
VAEFAAFHQHMLQSLIVVNYAQLIEPSFELQIQPVFCTEDKERPLSRGIRIHIIHTHPLTLISFQIVAVQNILELCIICRILYFLFTFKCGSSQCLGIEWEQTFTGDREQKSATAAALSNSQSIVVTSLQHLSRCQALIN